MALKIGIPLIAWHDSDLPARSAFTTEGGLMQRPVDVESATRFFDASPMPLAGTEPVAVLDKRDDRVHHVHCMDGGLLLGAAAGVLSRARDPQGCADVPAIANPSKPVFETTTETCGRSGLTTTE